MTQRDEIGRRKVIAAGAIAGAGLAGLALAGGGPARSAAAAEPAAGGRLAGKKVLIASGEYGESLETYYLKYRLEEEGAVAVVAAPRLKRLQLVVHDFEPPLDGYTEKMGYGLQSQVAYKEVDPSQFHGLLIPGGRAPEEIRLEQDLVRIVGHFMDRKLPLGAMCHGVMVVYTARPIKGRRLTAYRGIAPDIELLGGKFLDQEAVVDESLVTSRGWPDLPAFSREFVRLLAGK